MTAIAKTMNEAGAVIEHASGKLVLASGGGAANISIGFIPSVIKIFNLTNPSQHNWYKGMTAAYMEKQIANGTKSIVTSASISEYAGDDTHTPGFTIGTDSVLNTASDTLYYIAFR